MVGPSVSVTCKPASILVHEMSEHFWGCCQREWLRVPGPFPLLWTALSGLATGDQPEWHTGICASPGWRHTCRAGGWDRSILPIIFWAAMLVIQLIQQQLNVWTLLKGAVKLLGWVNSYWHHTENALENVSEPQWVKKQFTCFKNCIEGQYAIFMLFQWNLRLKEMFQPEAGRWKLWVSGHSFSWWWELFCWQLKGLLPWTVPEVLLVHCGWSQSGLRGLKCNCSKLQSNKKLSFNSFIRFKNPKFIEPRNNLWWKGLWRSPDSFSSQILNISKDGYFTMPQVSSIAYLIVKIFFKPQLHNHKRAAFSYLSILVPFSDRQSRKANRE